MEKILASGHPDLDDLPCESTVCTSVQQAYCEATKNMIGAALDKNCDGAEEESLRCELVRAMRKKGVSAEKRYLKIKDIIINASRAFHAEKTYYTVKRSAIIPYKEADEETMIAEALKMLGETDDKAGDAPGTSARNGRQLSRDPSLRGRGRVVPPLPRNEEALARKRARHDYKH